MIISNNKIFIKIDEIKQITFNKKRGDLIIELKHYDGKSKQQENNNKYGAPVEVIPD